MLKSIDLNSELILDFVSYISVPETFLGSVELPKRNWYSINNNNENKINYLIVESPSLRSFTIFGRGNNHDQDEVHTIIHKIYQYTCEANHIEKGFKLISIDNSLEPHIKKAVHQNGSLSPKASLYDTFFLNCSSIQHLLNMVKEFQENEQFEDFYLDCLRDEDAPLVNESWLYRNEGSLEYIRECIAYRPTACIRCRTFNNHLNNNNINKNNNNNNNSKNNSKNNSNNNINENSDIMVAHALTHSNLSIGMLRTYNPYRRRGFAKIVAAQLILRTMAFFADHSRSHYITLPSIYQQQIKECFDINSIRHDQKVKEILSQDKESTTTGLGEVKNGRVACLPFASIDTENTASKQLFETLGFKKNPQRSLMFGQINFV